MYGKGVPLPDHDEYTRTVEGASETTRLVGDWEEPWDRECVPGCSPARCGLDPDWTECGYDTCQACAYAPADLKAMLEAMTKMKGTGHHHEWGYNELIFRAPGEPALASLMPAAVEAIFVQLNEEGGEGEDHKERGHALHRRFLEHFGVDAEAVPLVAYSYWKRAPFHLLSGERCP